MIDLHVKLPEDTNMQQVEHLFMSIGINHLRKIGAKQFVAAPMPVKPLTFPPRLRLVENEASKTSDVQGCTSAACEGCAGAAPVDKASTSPSPADRSHFTRSAGIAGDAPVPAGPVRT